MNALAPIKNTASSSRQSMQCTSAVPVSDEPAPQPCEQSAANTTHESTDDATESSVDEPAHEQDYLEPASQEQGYSIPIKKSELPKDDEPVFTKDDIDYIFSLYADSITEEGEAVYSRAKFVPAMLAMKIKQRRIQKAQEEEEHRVGRGRCWWRH